MKCTVALTVSLVLCCATCATASITGVVGPNSTLDGADSGFGPTIIPNPASVGNSVVANLAQQGFDEAQGVVLTSDLLVDQGIIPAGTRVDSHMIFLNRPDSESRRLRHFGVTWTFASDILGTMSDVNGTLEAASNAILGAAGTAYPGAFGNRGLEGNDSISIAGNQLSMDIDMVVTQPGDWIRVVTISTIPEPGSVAVWSLLGLAGVVGAWRHSRNRS